MVRVDNPRRERIVRRYLEEELRESFIDYSMSVIVQRALPDARDGLKPAQRRILYAMHELGLTSELPHKKSATVVGDVLGKYHPHGDTAVYDTLVRMAQEFSMRCPLVDGQGNFGSIDGDSAAAYRYTEARLAPIAVELLRDIDKETVEFRPNFDGRLDEPIVLPAAYPELLVNGSDGIAVGMATKLPPHNLREIAAAATQLLTRPNTSFKKLSELVAGPDFPTGAYIWGRKGVESAARTGRGRVVMRARVHVEPGSYGKSSLVITELPYQISKQRVVESIAALARRGSLPGATDLRDESDRDGIRIVLELKRDSSPRKILEKLFRKTQLQTTYGVIMLALVDGVPRQLGLKEALTVWIEHRLSIVQRRARFDLEKARDRAHVVEGLLAALDEIDMVVEIVRRSRTPETAAKNLRSSLKITARQAEAILAMRLSRLTNLESRKLRDEWDRLQKEIRSLESLLADEKKRRDMVRRELAAIAEKFGDSRRTEILSDESRFPIPTQGAEQELRVLMTRRGYIKALPVRNGQGSRDAAAAESLEERRGDFVTGVWLCTGDDQLLAFTPSGDVHASRVSELPQGTRSSRGRRLADLLGLAEEPVAVDTIREFTDNRYVVTVSERGRVKRTALAEYSNIRSGGIRAAGVESGDAIVAVVLTDGREHLILTTRDGYAIRFDEAEVRPMGRTATGVKGIQLGRGDRVVAVTVARRNATLLTVTSEGFVGVKRVDELRVQGRGGKGARIVDLAPAMGAVVGVTDVLGDDTAIAVTESGESVTVSAESAVEGRRTTRGSRGAVAAVAGGGVVDVSRPAI